MGVREITEALDTEDNEMTEALDTAVQETTEALDTAVQETTEALPDAGWVTAEPPIVDSLVSQRQAAEVLPRHGASDAEEDREECAEEKHAGLQVDTIS